MKTHYRMGPELIGQAGKETLCMYSRGRVIRLKHLKKQ
jgi:hypothetical protein